MDRKHEYVPLPAYKTHRVFEALNLNGWLALDLQQDPRYSIIICDDASIQWMAHIHKAASAAVASAAEASHLLHPPSLDRILD